MSKYQASLDYVKNNVGACPFCGSGHCEVQGITSKWVHCMKCGADGPEIARDSLSPELQAQQAIDKWNDRESKYDNGWDAAMKTVEQFAFKERQP